MDDSVSLNALTMEELGNIVRNDKYHSLLSELLPLYDDNKSRECGSGAKIASGSHRSRLRTRHDDVRENATGINDPLVEQTPVRRLPRRKRQLKVGRKGKSTSARKGDKLSAGGTDTSPVAKKRGADHSSGKTSRGADHSSRQKSDEGAENSSNRKRNGGADHSPDRKHRKGDHSPSRRADHSPNGQREVVASPESTLPRTRALNVSVSPSDDDRRSRK